MMKKLYIHAVVILSCFVFFGAFWGMFFHFKSSIEQKDMEAFKYWASTIPVFILLFIPFKIHFWKEYKYWFLIYFFSIAFIRVFFF